MDLGGATEQPDTPVADCRRQVQQILQSVSFRNSTTLQQLLEYLTKRSLEGGPEQLKEYTIGVEAFGRSTDFDPKTDTIVRVQIHRLRQKLKEYYDGEGRLDTILVEIPKGHYLPTFEPVFGVKELVDARDQTPQNPEAVDHVEAVSLQASNRKHRAVSVWAWIAITAALTAAFGVGLFVGTYRLGQTNTQDPSVSLRASATSADPVKAFWASFVGDDTNPVIAYPDAIFLLDETNDLFRYRRGASDDRGSLVDPHLAQQFASNPKLVTQAGSLYFENGYTGTGELQAVATLAGLFGQMGLRPIIKPSRDITPVDLRQHSLILLGSSFQNVAVAQLMSPGDFQFKNPDSRLEQWRAEITNKTFRSGEAGSYHTERDPTTRVLKQDFAIFSVQPGVVPGRHIAVLGGLDTTGTDGATMYATSTTGIVELFSRLPIVRKSGSAIVIPQFQTLLRVRLERGYEVLGVSLEAVHRVDVSNEENTVRAPTAPSK